MRVITVLLTGWLLLGLAACAPPPAAPSPAEPPSSPSLHRLYFGRGMPEGREVSPTQWTDFLREEVTPRFPGGLTHWPAQGQWRSDSGALGQENSFVLEVIVPAENNAAAIESFRAVIDAYKEQFEQESVLWLRDPKVDVTFR